MTPLFLIRSINHGIISGTVSHSNKSAECRFFNDLEAFLCDSYRSGTSGTYHFIWITVKDCTDKVYSEDIYMDHQRYTSYDSASYHFLFSGACAWK